MIWMLTYQPKAPYGTREPHTIPWVASDAMTKDAIMADFEARFPGKRVVSLEPAEEWTA